MGVSFDMLISNGWNVLLNPVCGGRDDGSTTGKVGDQIPNSANPTRVLLNGVGVNGELGDW